MQQAKEVAIPKIYRLVVDKEEHVETVKKLLGIEHHIDDVAFFEALASTARKHPDPTPVREKEKWTGLDDVHPELSEHVVTSLETVRKRRKLVLDLPRLMTHSPFGEGCPPILMVVSVAHSPGGYVNLVPEALGFMVDVNIVIRNGEMTDLRERGSHTVHDAIIPVFPPSMRYRTTLR